MSKLRRVDADAISIRSCQHHGADGAVNATRGHDMKSRRDVLKQGSILALLVGCGALTMEQARAADASGFDAKSLDEALKILGGKPPDSKDVAITSPDIAENGAVVPIGATAPFSAISGATITMSLDSARPAKSRARNRSPF
jgi:predicted secreted protein